MEMSYSSNNSSNNAASRRHFLRVATLTAASPAQMMESDVDVVGAGDFSARSSDGGGGVMELMSV